MQAVANHRTGQAIRQELKADWQVLDRHIREGRFQRSLALVAGFSGLLGGLEVTLAHYKGSYGQRVMYSPLLLSSLLCGAGIAGAVRPRAARTVLPLASIAMLADGVIGFGFHVRGIARKPGGWRLPVSNIVMGPPVFAPLLLAVGGYFGVIASMLRPEEAPPKDPPSEDRLPVARASGPAASLTIREGRFQRNMCVAMTTSALLNGFEALYSHYKTNFSVPAQWIPVVLTPPLVVVGLVSIRSEKIARTYLPAISLVAVVAGGVGFYYHARGIRRRPGGMKLPFYNLIYGPPLFAPLLFAATGFMGLLASRLRRAK